MEEYRFWFNKAWKDKLVNKQNTWKVDVVATPGSSLFVPRPFVIKFNLGTKCNLAGFYLQGRINTSLNYWWKDITSLFVGLGDNSHRIYIDVRDGKSANAKVVYNQELKIKINMLLLVFDRSGKNMIIKNERNQILANISFSQRLFPDDRIYVGYALGSNASLTIYELLLSPNVSKESQSYY